MTRFKIKSSPERSNSEQSMWANAPFPQRKLFSDEQILIESECGQHCDSAGSVLARWPDQSIQWMQLFWKGCPCCDSYWVSTIAGNENKAANTVANSPQEKSSTVNTNTNLHDTLLHIDLSIVVELANKKNLEFTPNEVLIDQTQTTLLEADIADEQGQVQCRCLIQVKPLSGKALQAWTIILRNPRKANHRGGIWELGDLNSLKLRHATVRLNLKNKTAKPTRCLVKAEREFEWIEVQKNECKIEQYGSGERLRSSIHLGETGLEENEETGYLLLNKPRSLKGRRATPSAVIEADSEYAFGIHCKNFWQKFPQNLCLKPDFSLHYEFLPKSNQADHEIQGGEQVSCEFLLAEGTLPKVQSMLDAYSACQKSEVDPAWIAKSHALPWLTTRDKGDQLPYLSLVDQAILGHDSFFEKREKIGQYGWRHFGDVWGDHEAIHSSPDKPLVSHYNNQYDMVLGLGINYLRSGDTRWFELMRDLARHVIDIDIYHTDEDLCIYNNGMFWHTVHYVDAGLSTHRSYPQGTCGGGPSSGHAYSRGLYLYYCLTGDLTAKEAVVEMGNWMIASEDGSGTKYRYLAGGETGFTTASGTEDYHGPGRGPANCVEVLVTAFEATHERKFLNQAELIIRRVVHPSQNIEELDLLDSENKWFYLMFLQALGRYLEVKISLNEIDRMYSYAKITLLRYADWVAEHEYPFLDKPETLEFPTETWAAQDMRKVEALQWAARHGSEEQKNRFLLRASFFFNESIRQLNEFETKNLCRPIALLLSNGYSHDFFASGQLDKMPPSPPPSVTTFAPHKPFQSQKTRAIRNAKLIIACSGMLIILLMFSTLLILLRG